MILIMRDNYLTAQKKSNTSTWAIRNGFPFAVSYSGHVPDNWIEE